MKKGRVGMYIGIVIALWMIFCVFIPNVRAERLVSDPYPTTGTKVPDNCQLAKNGGAFVSAPIEAVAGGVRCTFTVTGDDFNTIVYSAKACQGVLCSTASPFVPRDQIPGSPGGWKVLGN